ncbi:hypothetical protein, partial [Bacillus cereus group sp. Bce037]
EPLAEQAQHDITMPDMAIGLYEWALIVDHQQQAAYWVGLNLDQAQTWFASIKPSAQQDFQLTSAWSSNMSAQQYQQKFNQIEAYLLSGDCY